MSTFSVMTSCMLRLSWRAACFSNRFCHSKFSSNSKEGLLFTGALAVPVDNLNRRFRCNRSLISCEQFTAINIHSLRAAVSQTFEQKKKLEKKKVIVDVQRVLSTAKQRRLTRLLVLIPGGYSSEFSVGVCRPVPQILTQFQTKTYHFPHPFSDLSS